MVVGYDCWSKRKIIVLDYRFYCILLFHYKEILKRPGCPEAYKDHCNDCTWFIPGTIDPMLD